MAVLAPSAGCRADDRADPRAPSRRSRAAQRGRRHVGRRPDGARGRRGGSGAGRRRTDAAAAPADTLIPRPHGHLSVRASATSSGRPDHVALASKVGAAKQAAKHLASEMLVGPAADGGFAIEMQPGGWLHTVLQAGLFWVDSVSTRTEATVHPLTTRRRLVHPPFTAHPPCA